MAVLSPERMFSCFSLYSSSQYSSISDSPGSIVFDSYSERFEWLKVLHCLEYGPTTIAFFLRFVPVHCTVILVPLACPFAPSLNFICSTSDDFLHASVFIYQLECLDGNPVLAPAVILL